MTQIANSQKRLWPILAIVFFGFFGLSMPYLIFPSLFLNPSYSILPADWSQASRGLFLGITLATYPLGQFLGSPILGALSDDYGRRKILSTSLLITTVSTLLTALSLEWGLLWLLILSRFFAGFMEGNISIARAMAADMKERNKHETFGKINAASSIAYVLGPLTGGLLSDHSIYGGLKLSTPFYITSSLYLILSILSYLVLNERSKPSITPKRSIWQRVNFIKKLSILFQNQTLKRVLLTVTLHTLAIDLFYEFGPVYLTMKWLLGPAQLAIYNSALSLALTISSGWVAGRLAKKYPNRKILQYSIITIIAVLIGIVITNQPAIMLVLFATIGFAIAIVTTNLTVQVSDAASDEIQGEVMGTQTSLRVLGDALICLLGGALLAISPKLLLLLAACISTSSLVYYLSSAKK